MQCECNVGEWKIMYIYIDVHNMYYAIHCWCYCYLGNCNWSFWWFQDDKATKYKFLISFSLWCACVCVFFLFFAPQRKWVSLFAFHFRFHFHIDGQWNNKIHQSRRARLCKRSDDVRWLVECRWMTQWNFSQANHLIDCCRCCFRRIYLPMKHSISFRRVSIDKIPHLRT
jgi:hypothetical protein